MKRSLLLIFAAMAVGAVAQKENAAVRREVTDYMRSMADAISAKDMGKIDRMLHPSFVAVDKDGNRYTLSQAKQMWKAGMANMRDIECKIEVKHVQLQSLEANVWYAMTMDARGPNGQPIKWSGRFCDTLKRSGNAWKATYSMELPTDYPWSFNTVGGGK